MPSYNPYVLLIYSEQSAIQARYMLRSLIDLGNMPADQPVWAFGATSNSMKAPLLEFGNIEWHDLDVPEGSSPYYFKRKVLACAQAEALAQVRDIPSLTWLASTVLFFQEPVYFSLADDQNVALRPVHHRNIGALADAPLDAFWMRLYAEMKVPISTHTVKSYADSETLLPYFNSHMFAIRTEFNILQRWRDTYLELISNSAFQKTVCADVQHQVFLHQAVLSTLLDQYLPWESIIELPANYSYPLDLHDEIHARDQVTTLNQITCAVYETPLPTRTIFHDIRATGVVAAWIAEHCPESAPS